MRRSKRIVNGIKNIDKVAEGIFNFKFPKKGIENIARKRAKHCVKCKHFMNESIPELIVNDSINCLSGKMCNLCGCVLSYKLRTQKITTTNCPLNEK